MVTVSRELDLRLQAGLNIQGVGGGFDVNYLGNYLISGNGGGSGHFAIMNFSNLAAIDKKLVVKIGAGAGGLPFIISGGGASKRRCRSVAPSMIC